MIITMKRQEEDKYDCAGGEEFSEKRTKRFFEVLSYNWVIMPSTVIILFVSEFFAITWLDISMDIANQQSDSSNKHLDRPRGYIC